MPAFIQPAIADLRSRLGNDDLSAFALLTELMNHFLEVNRSPWIGGHTVHGILQRDALFWAMDIPCLLHAILAIAAAHLSYLWPNRLDYHASAIFHYQWSLKLFQPFLSKNHSATDADAALGTGVLLAQLAFYYKEEQSLSSSAIPWVRALQSIPILLQIPSIGAAIRTGPWGGVIAHLNGIYWTAPRPVAGPMVEDDAKQLERLNSLCLDESVESWRSTLIEAYAKLEDTIRCLRRTPWLDRFFVTLPSGMMELWGGEHPVAMLILAFWCALISRSDEWWLARPALAECRRICDRVVPLLQPRFAEVITSMSTYCDLSG